MKKIIAILIVFLFTFQFAFATNVEPITGKIKNLSANEK